MKEPLTITTERVDDIPLLIGHMQRMNLASLLDEHFPTHGHWQGPSLGEVTMIWLAHVLTEGDHRMNHVQPWTEHRLETLRICVSPDVDARDVADDRLAAILRLLSEDDRWHAFERDFNGQLLRVYALEPTCVRLDSTTVSSYAAVTEEGLLQWGHSKDHRPDLPQLKVMLATLDPLGLPLATEVVSGERADDPLYLPVITRVQESLKQSGLLYVGDCKMGSLQTRAHIHASHDFYLCPLSAVVVPTEQLAQMLAMARKSQTPLQHVERRLADATTQRIAEGYEQEAELSAIVNETPVTWIERRLLVHSLSHAESAQSALQTRLKKAQEAVEALVNPKSGKRRLRERTEVEETVAKILSHWRVQGLLTVNIEETVQETIIRAYRGREAHNKTTRHFTLSCHVEQETVQQALDLLGWRVYATNQPAEQFSLPQAVLAYREEYVVEHCFGRLKGHPLSLAPMYVQRDDHATGLVRLLSIALRILTLLEGVVRQRLEEEGSPLHGLYAGQPSRATAKPTAERILSAFDEISLTLVHISPSQTLRHLTPLSRLQLRILSLLDLSPQIYMRLVSDSS
jgi:transposase